MTVKPSDKSPDTSAYDRVLFIDANIAWVPIPGVGLIAVLEQVVGTITIFISRASDSTC